MRIFARLPAAQMRTMPALCVLAAGEKYDILMTGDLSEQAEYRLAVHHDRRAHGGAHRGRTPRRGFVHLRRFARNQKPGLCSSLWVRMKTSFGHPADETLCRIKRRGQRSSRPICPAPSPSGVSKWQKTYDDGAAEKAQCAALKSGFEGRDARQLLYHLRRRFCAALCEPRDQS